MTADVPLDPLEELRWNWDAAYKITTGGGHYLAQRRDDGRLLTAGGPKELRELIVEDYATEPVREAAPLAAAWPGQIDSYAYLQGAVLASCFPSYSVSVLPHRDGRPRFQAVSRDGGDPWCLISADASEVWDELRRDQPGDWRPYLNGRGDGLFVWSD
jgi:hypothetical protein